MYPPKALTSVRHAEAQASQEISRIRGGIEVQMTSGKHVYGVCVCVCVCVCVYVLRRRALAFFSSKASGCAMQK